MTPLRARRIPFSFGKGRNCYHPGTLSPFQSPNAAIRPLPVPGLARFVLRPRRPGPGQGPAGQDHPPSPGSVLAVGADHRDRGLLPRRERQPRLAGLHRKTQGAVPRWRAYLHVLRPWRRLAELQRPGPGQRGADQVRRIIPVRFDLIGSDLWHG